MSSKTNDAAYKINNATFFIIFLKIKFPNKIFYKIKKFFRKIKLINIIYKII